MLFEYMEKDRGRAVLDNFTKVADIAHDNIPEDMSFCFFGYTRDTSPVAREKSVDGLFTISLYQKRMTRYDVITMMALLREEFMNLPQEDD